METRRETLIEEILQAQKKIFATMRAAAEPHWLELDLTMAQLKGLMVLAQEGPMPIGHFAAALGIGKPAASILIERLVEHGLVDRAEDSEDRRRTFARLTGRGEELVAKLRQGGPERLRGWLGNMRGDDLAALRRGLAALVAASERDTPTQNTKASSGEG